jgi:hypothetical protein
VPEESDVLCVVCMRMRERYGIDASLFRCFRWPAPGPRIFLAIKNLRSSSSPNSKKSVSATDRAAQPEIEQDSGAVRVK